MCSTTKSLIHSTESWYENIDDRQDNLAIFLGRKAFDIVDHKVLLRKLESHGLRDIARSLFASYFDSREEYYKLDCHYSKPKMVTRGILQKSCFGPLLLIVYLDDFDKCLKVSKAGVYADDTYVSLS